MLDNQRAIEDFFMQTDQQLNKPVVNITYEVWEEIYKLIFK
jgi:hypothetical protein